MATNLQFIKSATADSVSSFTVTDMFSAQYDVYEVFIRGNGSQNVSSLSAEFLDSGGSDIAQGAYGFAVLRLNTAPLTLAKPPLNPVSALVALSRAIISIKSF